jgi:hypothetical protein
VLQSSGQPSPLDCHESQDGSTVAIESDLLVSLLLEEELLQALVCSMSSWNKRDKNENSRFVDMEKGTV